jgi:PRTRC genetic system protein C
MAVKVESMPREFVFDDAVLPDPNPALGVEQVRAMYIPQYPELTNATLVGPEARDGKMRYRFQRAVGAKG